MKKNIFLDKIKKTDETESLIKVFLLHLDTTIKHDLNYFIYVNDKINKVHKTFSLYQNSLIYKLNSYKMDENIYFKAQEKNYTRIIKKIEESNSFCKITFLILSAKEKKISIKKENYEEILNYLLLKLFAIHSIQKQNQIIKLREKGIIAVREFADLLNYLEFKDRNAFQSMFLGFAAESISADRVTLYFYQSETKQLFPSFIMVYKNKKLYPYDFYAELKDTNINIGEDVCGHALSEQEPIHLNSIDNKIYKGIVDKKINMTINSIISIPLIIRDHIFGVIEVANTKKNKPLDKFDYYIVSIITKLAISKIEHSQLYHWAIIDNLTQLYNFHYYQIVIEKEITRLKRHPHDLCVIIMDIDDFKTINDTYGHPSGNTVLKTISTIIKSNVRKNVDIPIRFGGDEFLLILPETNIEGAKNLSNRMLTSIRNHDFKIDKKTIKVTCSFGISTMKPKEDISKEELIKKADDALYKSKHKGKNQVTLAEN